MLCVDEALIPPGADLGCSTRWHLGWCGKTEAFSRFTRTGNKKCERKKTLTLGQGGVACAGGCPRSAPPVPTKHPSTGLAVGPPSAEAPAVIQRRKPLPLEYQSSVSPRTARHWGSSLTVSVCPGDPDPLFP